MSNTSDFLVEIGTEELPAKGLEDLSLSFQNNITAELKAADLDYETIACFVTPRRLAVLVTQLSKQQTDKLVERKGPAVQNSIDKEGKPTPAALGFAKSCGVSFDKLSQSDIGKNRYLIYKQKVIGEKTENVLSDIVKKSLNKLSTKKSMRWGSHEHPFIRPVHWILMLFGKQTIPAVILNQTTSNKTYGHRFHNPQPITIEKASDYINTLEKKGYVIPSFSQRKALIKKQTAEITKGAGEVILEEDLLDEVTGLVEWPVSLLGNFPERFLKMPKEVLITTLKTHQKCFPVMSQEKKLLPYFITVSNIESKHVEHLILDNTRVICARLSDAEFFYQTDLKQSLEERSARLKNIVFQTQLGSLFEKTQRMEKLAAHIAEKTNINSEKAKQAALLSKSDLITEMVSEFPSLQGIMGYYYALADKLPEPIAKAIGEHYQPRFSGDGIPTTSLGCTVALADKIDTLVGIFGINQIPTGEKDPFALRRAALGTLRIMIEKEMILDLDELLKTTIALYDAKIKDPQETKKQLFDFIFERLKSWYLEQGISTNIFSSVLACHPTKPLDFHLRIKAVQHFKTLPQAEMLAAMNKRVHNLLKKQGEDFNKASWDTHLFEHKSEHNLAHMIEEKKAKTAQLRTNYQYVELLTTLTDLQPLIDHYFDEVLVMVDNEKVRENRLLMLCQLHKLFLQVADISQL